MKSRIIALIVFALCFSCSDDNGNEVEDILTAEIFELIAYEIDTSLDFDNNGISSTNLVGEIGCFKNEKLYIRSDGTGTSFSTGDPVYRESVNPLDASGISKFVTCNVTSAVTVEFTWNQNNDIFETSGESINNTGTKTDSMVEFTIVDGFTFTIVNDQGEEVILTQDVRHRYELVQE